MLVSFSHNYILIFWHKIECGIDEWATGTRVDINFTEEAYKPVFEEHFKSSMSSWIIAGSMVALSLCRGFWSGCMIMDGAYHVSPLWLSLICILVFLLVLNPFKRR